MESLFAALARMEGPILLWFQSLRGLFDPAVKVLTHMGDHGAVWIALCVLLLFSPKTRKLGLCGGLALALNYGLVNLLIKPLVARPRPWLVVEGLTALVAEKDPHSFPSGHSSAAFSTAVALVRARGLSQGQVSRWAAPMVLLLAAAVALSRLYVGVHYPSDVLCGALLGALCGWAAGWLFLSLDRPRTPAVDN